MRKSNTPWVAAVLALALIAVPSSGASAWHPTDDPTDLELANAVLSRQTSLEGMVLLDNHNGVLPIAKTGNLAVYGCGAMSTVKGGTGSGAVNNRPSGNISARRGFEDAGYTITTSDQYWSALDAVNGNPTDASCASYELLTAEWAPSRNFKWESDGLLNDQYTYNNPAYPDVPLTYSSVRPSAPTDTALYFVSRNSGEHWDRYNDEGDYLLSATERTNITLLGATYPKVVVIINVGGIIDTKFFDEINTTMRDPKGGDPLDALFLLSQAGQEGGAALPTVLNGTESPSGKLTDTWAKDYSYYPAAATFSANDYSGKTHFPNTFPAPGVDEDKYKEESYSEGIFVGYRYFDSFYKTIAKAPDTADDVVVYPFGFGLSYTDFEIETDSVTADLKGNVTVKATVSNVGKYTGKEVVEVYFSAPTTGLNKPYQELAGFGKTDKLAPGQAQQLTITFPTTELSSYDEARSAYVMDAGNYVIRVGNSSRNTAVGAVLTLGATQVTEQLSRQFRGLAPSDTLVSNSANFYTYPGEAQQIAAAPRVAIATAGFVTPNHASTVDQNVTVGASDPMYSVEGSKISSAKTYLPTAASSDWEGTGAPYQADAARGETVVNVDTHPAGVTGARATLWDVARGTITIEQFVASLSVDELTHIVVGRSSANAIAGSTVPSARGSAGFTTEEYEDLGIPSMSLPDGPAGLRITRAYQDTEFQNATAWPVAIMLAQSFNPQLIEKMGEAVGLEMDDFGATLWLAPALNLHRDPLCGRNFEYYSEDPLVSGLTAAYITLGVQSRPGRGVTLKHFAANNQEVYRSNVNETISERAYRELYLKGFEVAVRQSQPMAIMSSYNQVNGVSTFQDYDLLTDVLRGEWDFKGLVMTDWSSVIRGAGTFLATQYAGNDSLMPGSNRYSDVATLVKPVPPALDKTGLPGVGTVAAQTAAQGEPNYYTVLRQGFLPTISPAPVSPSQGYVYYTYDPASNFRVDAAGPVALAKTVDSVSATGASTSGIHLSTAANTVTRPTITTVDEAYEFVRLITGPVDPGDPWTSVLSAAEKAAVTVSGVVTDATGDVTSYTVSLQGRYEDRTLRLGDLQRNAANILNVTMRSQPFQYLTDALNVPNVPQVRPYSLLFEDSLVTFNSSNPGAVGQAKPKPTATASPSPSPTPSASGPAATPTVVKVKAAQALVTLVKGKSVKVYAAAYKSDGSKAAVAYKSSKKKVATVSKAGKITAKKAGKATVTVTAGGKKATVKVVVVAKKPAKSVVKKVVAKGGVPKSLAVGAVRYVAPEYSPASAVSVKVTYASSKASVASIDRAGRLVAKAKGAAKITVKAGKQTKTYQVTVK
ncbi:MAG: glycoside hydrolase family 3 C-terminal domain-containing protein [Bifidobacteriaceae bacterium]|jgi:beta-glucosidase|nr:glycoside hydrolase family 3 C-terminal domain-containing protein [Bifidobacteriaceae bacterium]